MDTLILVLRLAGALASLAAGIVKLKSATSESRSKRKDR